MIFIKNSLPIILLASTATVMYGADQFQKTKTEINKAFTILVVLEGHTKSVREQRGHVPDTDKAQYQKHFSNFLVLLNTDHGHKIAADYAYLNFATDSLESAVIMRLIYSMESDALSTGKIPAGYTDLIRILNGPASKQN